MLKKFVFFALFLSTLLTLPTITMASAAPAQSIGVVVIGNADVKTPDYFDNLENAFPSALKDKLVFGTAAQTKYQNYWYEHGFLDEQPLTKEAALDFVKYSGYEKVLFVIIKDPVIEKTERGSGAFYALWKETVRRASIEVKAYLFTDKTILKSVNVSKEANSATSDLRAKRNAFKKDMQVVAKEIKPYL